MRWPWTRRKEEVSKDRARAKAANINLDSTVRQLNRVLDRAEKVLDHAEKKINGGHSHA